MIRKAIALSCLSAVSMPALAVNSPNFDLIYEPSDGSVWFDTNGGRMINYVLQGGPYIGSNHVSAIIPPTFPAPYGSTTHQLGSSFLAASFLPDPVNIGNVLPAGLTESDFLARFTSAQYVENLSQPKVSFDLYYGQPAEQQPVYNSGPAVGKTMLSIGVQGLFNANGQPLSSSSKTMAVIDVDGDGIAGFDFSNWAGDSFLPDPDDQLVIGDVQGLWYEATGDGDLFESSAPAGVSNSVLYSDEATPYVFDVRNAANNTDSVAGAGDRVYLFYFPDLPIDASKPGPFQSFGVVNVGALSNPDERTNLFTLPFDTSYLADNSTGEGALAVFATVPEPATLGLIAAGGVLIGWRRRG